MKRTTSKDQNHHVLLRMHENEEAMVTTVTMAVTARVGTEILTHSRDTDEFR